MGEEAAQADLAAITEALQRDAPEGVSSQTALPEVYEELRCLSARYMRRERRDHTLSATALVHEAMLRLTGGEGDRWENPSHFFFAAAKTMRRILINHAREHQALKRGGGRGRVSLQETSVLGVGPGLDLLELDDVLERLRGLDEQKANIVELRFFGGCSIDETSEVLGVSTATVVREWRFARSWLAKELGNDGAVHAGDEGDG